MHRIVSFLIGVLLTGGSWANELAPLTLHEGVHEYRLSENVEYFRDPNGKFGIDEMADPNTKIAWVHHQGESPSFGYTSDTIWLRRTIDGTALPPQTMGYFIQVFYSMLDEIDVYYFENGELVSRQASGDTRPFDKRAIKHRNFVFPLVPSNEHATTVYIRIKSSGSLRLTVSIWDAKGFIEHEQNSIGWQGIFAGALLIMLFYNLALTFFTRDFTYFVYVLFIVIELLVMLQFRGLNYQYLWPGSIDWNEKALPFLVGILLATGSSFVGNFLGIKKSHPRQHKVLLGLVITGMLISLLTLVVPYTIIIRVASVCTALGMIYAMGLSCYLLYKGHHAVRFVVLSWCVLIVSGMVFILNANGYMPPSFLIENAVQLGAMIEIALLSLAFADRINIERKAKQMAQMALVEMQKQVNAELEQKVQERTNELELVNKKLKEMNTMDALTGVKNRGFFNANIDNEFKVSDRAQTPLTLIMLDIDHFKSINDEYGHQIGDQALIHISGLIKTVVRRPTDAISRYGGEEFAILLPHTNGDGALTVAERIRAVIEQNPLKVGELELKMTASLGYGVHESNKVESVERLIAHADEALYRAKNEGRNKVIGYTNDV